MSAKRNASMPRALKYPDAVERPLGARSLIASLLMGMEKPARSGSELVRWCALFDIPPGTTRVALSRMTERGELSNRSGSYELAGRLRDRSAEHEAARFPQHIEWDGTWYVCVITAEDRSVDDRNQLRHEMKRHHFCEQREGVWTRPKNVDIESMPAIVRQCRIWVATPCDDARQLASELFDTSRWSARAKRMLTGYAQLDTVDGDQGLRDVFLLSTAALAHLRADPILPPELLARDWPGDALRREYQRQADRFGNDVKQWFRSTA